MKSLLASKAPIVGIPVEGKSPVCVDGNRLRKWAKGVRIDRFEILVKGGEWYCEEQRPQTEWATRDAEGPVNLVAERTVEVYSLRIAGHVGYIRTSCTMVSIARSEAVVALRNWAEKERERLVKSRILGAISKDEKRRMKRAAMEDEGEGMIPVMCVMAKEGRRVEKLGLPVVIPEWTEMQFVLVKWGDGESETISFTVTEAISGQNIGSGKTGEAAILDARQNTAKQSPEKLAKTKEKILNDALAQAIKDAEKLTAA